MSETVFCTIAVALALVAIVAIAGIAIYSLGKARLIAEENMEPQNNKSGFAMTNLMFMTSVISMAVIAITAIICLLVYAVSI